MTVSNKYKIQDLLFAFSFAAIVVFLFWRVKYGFANIDECYYIATPYRFWQGDSMIVHEWSMVQLYTFLTLPLVCLHMALVGSTDGIVLTFRYGMVFLCAFSSLYCYFHLKKIDHAGIGSALAALVLLSYIPFGINSLSYNSMGILFLAMAFASFASPSEKPCVSFLLSGLFLAAAVLCCPYLVVLYVLYTAVMLLPSKIRSRFSAESFTWKAWLWLTAGAGILAVLFLIYVFSRASFSEILESIPYIFDDPSHATSSSEKLILFFSDPYSEYNSKRELACCVAICAAAAVCRWRGWKYPAVFFFTACTICVLVSILKTFVLFHYINFLPLPLNFLVLAAYAIPPEKDKRISKLFWRFWLPSLIYTFCLHLSSNQKTYVIASASLVPLVAGIVIIAMAAENLDAAAPVSFRRIRFATAISCIAVVCLLGCQLWLRYQNNFWDSNTSHQTASVSFGPHKGTIITPERLEEYTAKYNSVIDAEQRYQPESVFFAPDSYQIIYYLFGDVKTAATAAWTLDNDDSGKNRAYFELHPEKLPDMIYCSPEGKVSFLAWLYESEEYFRGESDSAEIYIRKNLQEELKQ